MNLKNDEIIKIMLICSKELEISHENKIYVLRKGDVFLKTFDDYSTIYRKVNNVNLRHNLIQLFFAKVLERL